MKAILFFFLLSLSYCVDLPAYTSGNEAFWNFNKEDPSFKAGSSVFESRYLTINVPVEYSIYMSSCQIINGRVVNLKIPLKVASVKDYVSKYNFPDIMVTDLDFLIYGDDGFWEKSDVDQYGSNGLILT